MAFNPEDFNTSGPRNISTATDWNDKGHRTSIAASLVQGVYILEQDRQNLRDSLQALAPPWWNSFNFQLHKELSDDTDASIFGAIYKFESPLNTFSTLHHPRYVIAFRGTVLKPETIFQDIKLDLEITCLQNKLQYCSRAEKALEAVKELIDDVGAEDVWLAGHSLGSAIALIVGRNVVKLGFHLETYLFNPPFSSAATALELLIKNKILKHGARIMGSLLKVGLSASLTGHHHAKDDHFSLLSSWTPYLFVNPRDLICSEYIPYFEHRKTMKFMGASRIGKRASQISLGSIATSWALGYKTEPYHLIPTACVVINKNMTRKPGDAHALAQWWTESTDRETLFHRF